MHGNSLSLARPASSCIHAPLLIILIHLSRRLEDISVMHELKRATATAAAGLNWHNLGEQNGPSHPSNTLNSSGGSRDWNLAYCFIFLLYLNGFWLGHKMSARTHLLRHSECLYRTAWFLLVKSCVLSSAFGSSFCPGIVNFVIIISVFSSSPSAAAPNSFSSSFRLQINGSS